MPNGRPPGRAAEAPVPELTAEERLGVYGARRFLGSSIEKKHRVQIPFDVYFQDPAVAEADPKLAFDECFVSWEPSLADGPTSARFAVVDYDGHLDTLAAPAKWDDDTSSFLDPDGKRLDRVNKDPLQFHQVSVWATVQGALEFFEEGSGLGRRIPWAFDGSRLIVVPHAGPGENAYYDRKSKSLQFYYFDRDDQRIYTCLSSDIIRHELGHAILDGIRPHLIESVLPETAAFHEFMGDLTAILIALRNTDFRTQLIRETKGDLLKQSTLSRVAEQFGEHVRNQPYLRTALNELTMSDVADDQRPHQMSQVLTGAMFDILVRLSKNYMGKARDRTVAEAFWNTIQRMQHMAIQPLDLLPPVDVTFRDYALAVLRAEQIANPTDPDNYRGLMLDVFVKRGILDGSRRRQLSKSAQLFDRPDFDVFLDTGVVATSPADAYLFLNDNRRKLFIPPNVDVTVGGLYTARKSTREQRRLPRQIVLQYLWREDVLLDGPQFGSFQGSTTSLLCGGTLAFDENGEILHHARKPGSQWTGDSDEAAEEQAEGARRRKAFREALSRRIRAGRIGTEVGGAKGLLGKAIPPLISREIDGALRFELSPHFLGVDDQQDESNGGRSWQISS
jgi:hypothetical protein